MTPQEFDALKMEPTEKLVLWWLARHQPVVWTSREIGAALNTHPGIVAQAGLQLRRQRLLDREQTGNNLLLPADSPARIFVAAGEWQDPQKADPPAARVVEIPQPKEEAEERQAEPFVPKVPRRTKFTGAPSA